MHIQSAVGYARPEAFLEDVGASTGGLRFFGTAWPPPTLSTTACRCGLLPGQRCDSQRAAPEVAVPSRLCTGR